ncbi:MAG: aldehyde dehydrogenase family protein [Bernardetiaceae bacterium]|nr:aldehyde dehydrogenase family protein [Bernardetiaceae bacterium]
MAATQTSETKLHSDTHKSVDTSRILEVFDIQQDNRYNISTTTAKERIEKLEKLKDALYAHKDAFRAALQKDFRKSFAETDLTELYPVVNEIKYVIKHLEEWLEPQKVGAPTVLLGTKSHLRYEAKGVVLIIAPWNYPVNLTLMPLVSAIAAGNCVILKPSELTPHTSALLKTFIEKLFNPYEVAVFEGGVDVSQALLKLPFDHIFFTGSTAVGKIVMKAAAENLASVTLELGGKSPVIVDKTANLADTAKKIAWGKFTNCGQTCIAPDYILVEDSIADDLISLTIQQIKKFYGESAKERMLSPDYARIVNNHHFERIKNLIADAKGKGAKVHIGGTAIAEQRYIAPTILSNVNEDCQIMKEEIFGPVLPIITYSNVAEAIYSIRKKGKPLALYIFSQDKHRIEEIMAHTTAGGTCINDVLLHYFQHNLPFGGVNQSGIGKSHGFYGFEAFSNARAVLEQPTRLSAAQLTYPPYNNDVQTFIDFTLKWI